jgi:hypothetical protein
MTGFSGSTGSVREEPACFVFALNPVNPADPENPVEIC